MQVHRDYLELAKIVRPVLTIGSFDGVHLGHSKLLARIRLLAKEIAGESIVVTFDPHPRSIVAGGSGAVRLLTTTAEKSERLAAAGVDHLAVVPFTEKFALQSAKDYLQDFLFGTFRPHTVVIGYDHRFGAGRSGDIDLLRSCAQAQQINVLEIGAQDVEAIAVSSTRIRKAVESGDMRRAAQLLGSPYPLTGRVVHGEAIGRTLGFPTANLDLASAEKLLPADGVYACYARLLDQPELSYNAMLYIGERPSLAGRRPRSIEVNLLDFDDQIYGQMMRVDVLQRIRGDEVFSSLEELRKQIASDRSRSIEILSKS